MINTILVDDHSLFRLGVKTALSEEKDKIQLVGEANNANELFDLLKIEKTDIILLDIILPGMSGIEIAARLRIEYPEIKILVLSSENTPNTIRKLMDIGIDGFISKKQSTSGELVEAIESIMSGLEYFGKDIASIMYNVYISKKKAENALLPFTEREREIISLCKEGLLGKEVADRLCISPRTVDAHKNNIFKKLGISSTMEMVQYALKNGIISME